MVKSIKVNINVYYQILDEAGHCIDTPHTIYTDLYLGDTGMPSLSANKGGADHIMHKIREFLKNEFFFVED